MKLRYFVIIGEVFIVAVILSLSLFCNGCSPSGAISSSNITALQEQVKSLETTLNQAKYDLQLSRIDIKTLNEQLATIDLNPSSSRLDNLETRVTQYTSDMSVALEKAYTFEKIGQLNQQTVSDLQVAFNALSQDFAVLQANLNEKVQVTHAMFGDKIYAGSNSMAADIFISISNASIYDINNAKIHLTLKVDRDIPAVKQATISGAYVGYPWTFIGQDGQYLFFETNNTVWIPHNGQTQCYLKLYMTFVSKPVDTATIESEVILER